MEIHCDVWIIPSFRIWDYALQVDCCMLSTFYVSSRIVANISESSLLLSLGFAGGKYCRKIIIPIFRLVLQNFAIPGCFPYILFCRCLFPLLSSGWFVIAVCDSISVQGSNQIFRITVNWCRVNLMVALTFLCFFFDIFFLKFNCGLQIVCYLCEGR